MLTQKHIFYRAADHPKRLAFIIYQVKNGNINQEGFSIIELMIVMLVISILTVMAVLSFRGEKKYSADTEAHQVMDILHEARQKSLTQRETMRVEINKTRNTVRLISENLPGDAKDDKEIKVLKLLDANTVVIGETPKNVSKAPVEMSPTPVLAFKKSVYPLSSGNSVITLRYTPTGTVLDAGSNAIGDNSAMTGATIYIWIPNYSNAGKAQQTGNIIRAITVQGTSGLSRYWKCRLVNNACNWVQ